MKFNLLMLVALLSTSFFCGAHADRPVLPYSYKEVTKNEKYVFIMLPPENPENDREKLGEKYAQSGLYLNDGSTKPLWTIDWYTFNIDVSSDGQHLVRHGEWAPIGDNGETIAFTFYKNGTAIKSYQIKDLVPYSKNMPRSSNHYAWYQNWEFDDDKGLLSIETIETEKSSGKKYVFDITTGKITQIDTQAAIKK